MRTLLQHNNTQHTLQLLHCVFQKNVLPLACYNFNTCKRIFIFFGRNVTDKVSNQRRYTMPPQITCAFALPNKTGKYENFIFHSNAILVHCQNSTSRCLISSIFLTHDHTPLYDSLNLVINAFSSGLWGKKEVESAAAVGLCCMHNASVRCLLGFL